MKTAMKRVSKQAARLKARKKLKAEKSRKEQKGANTSKKPRRTLTPYIHTYFIGSSPRGFSEPNYITQLKPKYMTMTNR